MADEKYSVILSATSYKPMKGKEIQKDADGYYKVRLGAFNVFNAKNAFYIGEGVKDLINNPNSIFYRRLKKGYLCGEMGHPSMKPGMSIQQFIYRTSIVDQENIAFHIKDVMLVETGDKVEQMGNYGNVIIVEGWIKPSGPKGKYLQEALDNPDRNVAFSVRSVSKDKIVNGVIIKQTTSIATWDWVVEPGISNANTFDMLNEKNINTESVNNILTLNVKESDIADMVNVKTAVNQEANSEDIKILSNSLKRQFSSKPINKVLTW